MSSFAPDGENTAGAANTAEAAAATREKAAMSLVEANMLMSAGALEFKRRVLGEYFVRKE